jgi:signal transduction histidine kinase
VRHPLRLRSLKNKLALVFCGITALAMIATWFYVVPQLQDSLNEQKRDDLARVAGASVDPLRKVVGSDVRSPHLDELVRAVADSSDARVTLYGVQRSRGRPSRVSWVVSDSAAAPEVDETTTLADKAARAGRKQVGYGRLNGKKVVQTAVPLIDRGRADWVVLYSRTLDGVAETVDLIRRQLLLAGIVAGLLAVLGAYLAAGFVGRRVRRLERASRRVAAGQFVAPLPVDSEDELGQLTSAFNDMQQRLARVDRARKEFVANASHELRTPLFSLAGFIELLEDENDESSRAELFTAMHGQVQRMQKLAVDLLDLSRLDAGSFELERDRVDLAELARMVAGEFAPSVRRGAADVQLKTPEGGVEVTCDRERVAQIMRILVDNAIRHTPEGTHVTISTSRRNGTAKVTVADSGPGLNGGHGTQLFDRFFTGDSENGGAGLGLAIAKELAQRMHGEIRLNSRPGRTSFTLELPSDSGEDTE